MGYLSLFRSLKLHNRRERARCLRRARSCQAPTGRRTFVPTFDILEDRTVPSTFTVSNLNDSGAGSLRQAVLDANAHAGADQIAFASGLRGTITLTTGQLTITDSVTIDGWSQGGSGYTGPPLIELDGTNAFGALGSFGLNIQANNGGETDRHGKSRGQRRGGRHHCKNGSTTGESERET